MSWSSNEETLLTKFISMKLECRQATIEDLPDIVRMLADDFLGKQRERLEDPLPESYLKAFRELDADPNNELIVAVMSVPPTEAGVTLSEPKTKKQKPKTESIVGTLQLTVTPSLSYQGSKRSSVESVRVDDKFRGQGIGRQMMLWAIERAKKKGCVSMHLTSHGDRKDAHRFYENLGFAASHVGMKLVLK